MLCLFTYKAAEFTTVRQPIHYEWPNNGHCPSDTMHSTMDALTFCGNAHYLIGLTEPSENVLVLLAKFFEFLTHVSNPMYRAHWWRTCIGSL